MTTDDLVERLRAEGKDAFARQYSLGMFKLCAEVADEIERLRNQLAAKASLPNREAIAKIINPRAFKDDPGDPDGWLRFRDHALTTADAILALAAQPPGAPIEVPDLREECANLQAKKSILGTASDQSRLANCIKALKLARPIVNDWLHVEITNHSMPEKRRRDGSIKGCSGFYYNPDTISDTRAAKSVRQHRKALKKIDAALTPPGRLD